MPDIFSTNTKKRQPVKPSSKAIPTFPAETPSKIKFFAAFHRYPLGVSFADQMNDEKIILFVRKHFITNFLWIATTVLMLFVPFIVFFLLQQVNFNFSLFTPQFVITLLAFYYLIVVGFVFTNFITWFFNIGMITDKRAIDIDFYNLSSSNIAVTRLQDIEDVEYSQAGLASSFFDYGDVFIQTEATVQNFNFEKAPHPAMVVNIISSLMGGK